MRRLAWAAFALAAALLMGLVALRLGLKDRVREVLQPATPHEQYTLGLQHAGLDRTALGQGWISAAAAALREPVAVTLPFRESGYFAPHETASVGYRLSLRRGQRLVVEVAVESAEPPTLFVELFATDGSSAHSRPVAHAGREGRTLEFEPGREGDFVLRLQPELLRGGRYTVTQRLTAALTFPVFGLASSSVRSVFGDPRDAGRRQHHGIDIFAPRGTPAVAAVGALVTSVGSSRLGGKTVWLWDARRGHSLYYAHLDQQRVLAGQVVSPGDVVGLVGNTGNARGTPPHLHFGIYTAQGPIDPLPFVHEPGSVPSPITAELDGLGEWRRVARGPAGLRTAPSPVSPVLAHIPADALVRVHAASGGSYRVRLPDGRTGYLDAARTEAVDAPAQERRAEAAFAPGRPAPAAAAVDTTEPGSTASAVGRPADSLVRTETPTSRGRGHTAR